MEKVEIAGLDLHCSVWSGPQSRYLVELVAWKSRGSGTSGQAAGMSQGQGTAPPGPVVPVELEIQSSRPRPHPWGRAGTHQRLCRRVMWHNPRMSMASVESSRGKWLRLEGRSQRRPWHGWGWAASCTPPSWGLSLKSCACACAPTRSQTSNLLVHGSMPVYFRLGVGWRGQALGRPSEPGWRVKRRMSSSPGQSGIGWFVFPKAAQWPGPLPRPFPAPSTALTPASSASSCLRGPSSAPGRPPC